MDDTSSYATVRRKAWKVDVLDRLCHVTEDVRRAISVVGWTLNESGDIPQIQAHAQGTASGQDSPGAIPDGNASAA